VEARWTYLEASADERLAFPDAERLWSQDMQPAAPENRHRRVFQLEGPGGTYYLKEFRHTLWKNRWRNLRTEPRSWLDGEREAGVTLWLRERGLRTPRPVLVGSSGGRSFYLCAALAGRSLADWQRAGGLEPGELRAAASFLGRALALGAWLPDSSPEHVFLDRDSPEPLQQRFALLDFHNGICARKPNRKLISRVLRRFHRQAKAMHIPRARAMVFAARLLRAAGCQAWLRTQLGALPPLDTHGRYEVQGRSARYHSRNPRRAARELALLEAVWIGRPGDRVLDAPTGTGRLLGELAQRKAARMVGSDRAWAMLEEARERCTEFPLVQSDALGLPFQSRSLDGVVIFRFLHHLQAKDADRALAEAARVADRFVIFTFFHPCSLHALNRWLKERLRGRAATRFGRWPRVWSARMQAHGFRLVSLRAEGAYRRDLWIASFERVQKRP